MEKNDRKETNKKPTQSKRLLLAEDLDSHNTPHDFFFEVYI